jgi:aminoglycoside phosphotransferase (APT) family kinase protein
VDGHAVIAEVSGQLGGAWQLVRKLPGGLNQGAYLLGGPAGQMAVLKWHPTEPDRVAAATPVIKAAREHGWPTPAWLAVGTTRPGTAWVLQEFVPGQRPSRLDERVAALMVDVLEIQAGLGTLAGPGWSQWAWGTVFEDWGALRAAVRAGFPRGGEIVGAVDAIASSCRPDPLDAADLVHGNFEMGNTLLDGNRLWLVDAQGLSGGSRAYDVIEALMVASRLQPATTGGIARLWAYAETLPPRDVAVCAGSVGLSFAESFIRHGELAKAPDVAPGLLDALFRVRNAIT